MQFVIGTNIFVEFDERKKKFKGLYTLDKVPTNYPFDNKITSVLKQDNIFLDLFLNNSKIL